MVETRDDLLADDPFQHPEVHHHPAFGIAVVFDRAAFHRHEQPVGVPMYLTARPVVSVEGMRRLEREFLGQSDHCHRTKIVQAERKSKFTCILPRRSLSKATPKIVQGERSAKFI